MEQKSPNSAIKIVLLILFVLFLIAIPLVLEIRKLALIPVNSSDTGKPEIPVTDLAPGMPSSAKTQLIVKHADSTMSEFLIPKTMLNQYIQNLPKGDVVVSQK